MPMVMIPPRVISQGWHSNVAAGDVVLGEERHLRLLKDIRGCVEGMDVACRPKNHQTEFDLLSLQLHVERLKQVCDDFAAGEPNGNPDEPVEATGNLDTTDFFFERCKHPAVSQDFRYFENSNGTNSGRQRNAVVSWFTKNSGSW